MNYNLNVPDYAGRLRLREMDGRREIFDPIRRRWLALTPEEWVRQNMTLYISDKLNVSTARMANEVTITYNDLTRRCDSIVYDPQGNPLIIVEYKRSEIEITQRVFDQIAVYNLKLEVPYLIVSNGLQHIFCKVDLENKRYIFAESWPTYDELTKDEEKENERLF